MKKLNNEQMENLQGGLMPGPTGNGFLCAMGAILSGYGVATNNLAMDAGGLDMQMANCPFWNFN